MDFVPVYVSGTGVADDLYLTTKSQSKLQALLEIAAHYGKRYKIKYGASKTKITVVGSKVDMSYYRLFSIYSNSLHKNDKSSLLAQYPEG